jgi:hypothetical protein
VVRDALWDRVRQDDASTRKFFMEVAEQIGPGVGLPIEMRPLQAFENSEEELALRARFELEVIS